MRVPATTMTTIHGSLSMKMLAVALELALSPRGGDHPKPSTGFPSTTILASTGLVFDAGSSGSRIHVFSFDTKSGSVLNDVFVQIQPGLSAYADPEEVPPTCAGATGSRKQWRGNADTRVRYLSLLPPTFCVGHD